MSLKQLQRISHSRAPDPGRRAKRAKATFVRHGKRSRSPHLTHHSIAVSVPLSRRRELSCFHTSERERHRRISVSTCSPRDKTGDGASGGVSADCDAGEPYPKSLIVVRWRAGITGTSSSSCVLVAGVAALEGKSRCRTTEGVTLPATNASSRIFRHRAAVNSFEWRVRITGVSGMSLYFERFISNSKISSRLQFLAINSPL
jgi:hypothetical protein